MSTKSALGGPSGEQPEVPPVLTSEWSAPGPESVCGALAASRVERVAHSLPPPRAELLTSGAAGGAASAQAAPSDIPQRAVAQRPDRGRRNRSHLL